MLCWRGSSEALWLNPSHPVSPSISLPSRPENKSSRGPRIGYQSGRLQQQPVVPGSWPGGWIQSLPGILASGGISPLQEESFPMTVASSRQAYSPCTLRPGHERSAGDEGCGHAFRYILTLIPLAGAARSWTACAWQGRPSILARLGSALLPGGRSIPLLLPDRCPLLPGQHALRRAIYLAILSIPSSASSYLEGVTPSSSCRRGPAQFLAAASPWG